MSASVVVLKVREARLEEKRCQSSRGRSEEKSGSNRVTIAPRQANSSEKKGGRSLIPLFYPRDEREGPARG